MKSPASETSLPKVKFHPELGFIVPVKAKKKKKKSCCKKYKKKRYCKGCPLLSCN